MKFTLFLALAAAALAATPPQDVKLPDRLVSVTFYFTETIVDAAGTKPTITRPKGSVEINLAELEKGFTVPVYNPSTKAVEDVVFSGGEILALFKAIGERRWLETNPPPLPVNRRSIRNSPPIAAMPAPKS